MVNDKKMKKAGGRQDKEEKDEGGAGEESKWMASMTQTSGLSASIGRTV